MADTKISALDADTAPTGDDLVILVNDPGGTPGNKKSTVNNLLRYSTTFTDANLVASVLTVTHSRGFQYPGVHIVDNNGVTVAGFKVTYTDADNLNVDLSGFGTLTGTWRVVVI